MVSKKLMSQENFAFKSQFILENSSSINKGFNYNITYDSDNKVTGIGWMISYLRDNFERFGKHLPIDVMRSSLCNAKDLFTLFQLF